MSLELLKHKNTFLLYYLINHILVNIISGYPSNMIETGNSVDPSASLPYGMLLTKIFKAKGVSLVGCEFEKVD